MCQSDSTFRVLLRCGPRRCSLKMWFQALDFSVYRTAVNLCFSAVDRKAGTQKLYYVPTICCTQFGSRALVCASRSMPKNSILSPDAHTDNTECAGPDMVDWLCSWKGQRENHGAYFLHLSVCTSENIQQWFLLLHASCSFYSKKTILGYSTIN